MQIQNFRKKLIERAIESRRVCLNKYFLYGILICSFNNPNYGFVCLGVVVESALFSLRTISGLRDFCFSLVMFKVYKKMCRAPPPWLLLCIAFWGFIRDTHRSGVPSPFWLQKSSQNIRARAGLLDLDIFVYLMSF